MKKITLLSDTHGYLDEAILKYIDQSDETWHAGDIGTNQITDQIRAVKPLRAVYGNIDGHELRAEFDKDLWFDCEGLKVWMTHIGGYPGHYPFQIKSALIKRKPGLFICGHSHILKVIYDKQLQHLHINPGAAGRHGFHVVRTLVTFSVHLGQISDMKIVELGSRSAI